MGPCAGGAVYSPAVTDFTLMVKDIAHMFITGPDVIKTVTGEEVTFEELGGAMTHSSISGVSHFASEDEDECFEQIKTLLSYIPQNNLEDPPRIDTGHAPEEVDESIDELIPNDPNKPYDMRDVVRKLADNGEFFEVHSLWAQNMIVGFARFDGRSVGIVGNNPAHLAGTIDINASGTRKEELLVDKEVLHRMWILRKVLNPLSTVESMEFLLGKLTGTKSNQDFLDLMNR